MSDYHSHKATSGNMRRLKEFMQRKDNQLCADCIAPEPKWASANIGVFVCLKCSSAHRNLGVHVSKVLPSVPSNYSWVWSMHMISFHGEANTISHRNVLSVSLDEWEEEEVDSMIEVGGNISANAIYEAFIPKGFQKPTPDSTYEERLEFIRSKYLLQEFLKPSLRIVSFSRITSSVEHNDSRKNVASILGSSASVNMAGMVEFIGLLKVKVIRGIHLAIRDLMSSDPYVVLSIGQQKVQTRVIDSNLNPVWNEELMLSVPVNFGSVKLKVFDHDMFSADDIMGEAEIDVQPLITAASAFDDPASLGDMQIGKWLASSDNALLDDSIISIVDGRVKQDVHLKLQNVESGEIELELEWLPLDQ